MAVRSGTGRMLAASAAGVIMLLLGTAPGSAEAEDAAGGRSVLRITDAQSLPTARRVTIPLNKSLLVEMPVDVHDVLVAQPKMLDTVVLRPRRIYLLAKEVGETNVFFTSRDNQKQLILEISITKSYTDLGEKLAQLLPGSRIKVTPTGESITLSGKVAYPADAARAAEIAGQFVPKGATIVNLLATDAKEQVLLKVTVAEIQRSAMRRLGVNLPEALGKIGNITFSAVMKNAFAATGGATTGTSVAGLWQHNGNSVSGIIESLEQAGLSRTLAAPNLTAISGETAKFLAGGEFPVPVASAQNTITVSWKPFGVGVAFTPMVLSEGRISLKVAAEVSELSTDGAVTTGGISLPSLKVRKAETTVELPSGGALAMAGLLSDQTRQSAEGIPELKNVPVLGTLFRSRDYQRNETELVILVTPYLVNPVEAAELTRPDKGFAPASYLQGMFLGHLNRIYGGGDMLPAGRPKDNYGYIVEYPDEGGSK
jgi:pilus assembly protein CpaC